MLPGRNVQDGKFSPVHSIDIGALHKETCGRHHGRFYACCPQRTSSKHSHPARGIVVPVHDTTFTARSRPLASFVRTGLVCLREGRPVAAGPLDVFQIQGRLDAVAVAAWIAQGATAPFAHLPGAQKASPADSEVTPAARNSLAAGPRCLLLVIESDVCDTVTYGARISRIRRMSWINISDSECSAVCT